MRTAFHHIAYQSLDVCNALSWENLQAALTHAGARAGHRIADIGCGYGRTSILMAERLGAVVTAVDLDPQMAEGVRERADASEAADRVTVLNKASIEALRSLDPFDMIVALGTTFPAGTELTQPQDIFAELSKHLVPGGCLVWGDLTWTAEPPAPLRQMVEITGNYVSDPEWKAAAEAAGLEVVSSRLSDAGEWQHFQNCMHGDVAVWLEANPDHPDAPAMRQADYRIRLMLDFGKECLGFGLYVFRRPA